MDTAYLNAVNKEVLAVQSRLLEYARQHPKIATRLRLGTDIGSDPHVGRVIQAYAVLIARTRCRVEDAFPEIIEPIIQATLHPHLQAVPALAIAEFNIDPDQPPDIAGAVLPRDSELETELVDSRTCRFKTCADVEFWPIQLDDVAVAFPPFVSTHKEVTSASCAIRLSLTTMAGNILFSETEADRLRFFIHGELDESLRIHEALCCDVAGVQLVNDSGEVCLMPPETVCSAGFDTAERLLPGMGQPNGERLLSELLMLPERFLFFEIQGLWDRFRAADDVSMQINILLNSPSEYFPTKLRADSIRLNCAPIVNLHSTTTEPVEVDHVTSDVSLIVDSRNPDNDRIHEIAKVTIREEDETVHELAALHSIGNQTKRQSQSVYWLTLPNSDEHAGIRFVDLSGQVATLNPGIVEADVLCSNGNIPNRLATEGRLGKLIPVSPGPVAEGQFLTRPTMLTKRRPTESALPLISRSLPQPGTTSDIDMAESLKESLSLFAGDSDSLTNGLLQSIVSASIRRVCGIHRRKMVCHGLEVQITLDDEKTIPGGMFLFAEILRHVLARYATESTFVRFRFTTTSGREYGPCPTIAGERCNI